MSCQTSAPTSQRPVPGRARPRGASPATDAEAPVKPRAAVRGLAALLLFGLLVGCLRESGISEIPAIDLTTGDGAITVPANQAWTDSGVVLRAGEALTVVATGAVSYADSAPDHAGPEGTYLFTNDVFDRQFPVASGADGPAPCYGLIGRIGDSDPFFIGANKSWIVNHSGQLHLGINDFEVRDNVGQFEVRIHKPESVQPVRFERTLSESRHPGRPVPKARVVVIYVDGLRPDVVREMAALGQLPRIQEQFLDGGTWLSRSFTAFPSDTITSNGTMWTGCFSDRHGLKGQVRFNRRSLYSESYLEPLGPHRSSNLLSPRGIDAAVTSSITTTLRWTRGREASRQWRGTRHTGIAPLYERLAESGQTWATGVLPMMTEVPPLLWTRSLVKQIPYLQSHEAWKFIDDANTHYAIQHLLDQ
ncbi:MAG: alkaline phosphatase family protein, partial [Planctomycetaceae bacterium]